MIDSPTTFWTGQQIIAAVARDTVPRLLIRDRDGWCGPDFVRHVESVGIEQVLISVRSPRQNPHVERAIGSIRREDLDRVIVIGPKVRVPGREALG